MKVGEQLIGNAFFLFLDYFFVTILSLAYWLIIGKTLPVESYGLISTSMNIIILISGFSVLGLASAAPKLISEYVGKRQNSKIGALVRFVVKTTTISSLIFSFVLIILSSYLSPILKIETSTLILIAISFLAWSLWAISTSILHGFQNMKRVFQTNFIGNILKVILATFFILLGFGYLGPLLGIVLSVFLIVALRHDILLLKNKIDIIDKKNVFLKYALPAFIGGIALQIFNNASTIIITAIKDPSVTGLFAISATILFPLVTIPATLNSALFPIISELTVFPNAKKKQGYLIGLVIRYTLFITLPILIGLIFFANQAISLLSRIELGYLPAAKLFPLIGPGALILGIGTILHSSLYAIRKTIINRNIAIIATIFFLIISLPLTFFLSAFGTAIAYLASTTLYTTLSYLYLNRFLKLKLPVKNYFKVLIGSALLFLFFIATKDFQTNFLMKIIFIIIGLIIYILVLFPMRFYEREDVKTLQIISKKSPNRFRRYIDILSKIISKFI